MYLVSSQTNFSVFTCFFSVMALANRSLIRIDQDMAPDVLETIALDKVCVIQKCCLPVTGRSLNIVFFPWNFVNFLNSASSAEALVFYLPGVCTHTDTERKQRKTRVRNILKSSKKNTIFNEHLVTYRNLVIRKLFLFPIYIFHHSIGCHLTENTFFFYSSIWMEPRSQIFFWIQQVKNLSA